MSQFKTIICAKNPDDWASYESHEINPSNISEYREGEVSSEKPEIKVEVVKGWWIFKTIEYDYQHDGWDYTSGVFFYVGSCEYFAPDYTEEIFLEWVES